MFAVIAGDNEVEIEANRLEHLPMVHDARDRLLVGERVRLAHIMADDGVPHELFGEVEIALVSDDEVVQPHHLARRTGHSNTSSASISSIAATARSVSVRQS